ncbi:MAG TPA: hypothetical protein VIC87_07030, partial [Vicinamibacteria bacterium]
QATFTLTADEEGAPGNDITLTSSGATLAITTAGGKLAGAYDSASDEWPLESTLALSAAALAARINASETALIAGYVTASSSGAVVTVRAIAPGVLGNLVTFAKTGTHITVTGSGRLASGAGRSTAATSYSLL